jgi:hypothetical protein
MLEQTKAFSLMMAGLLILTVTTGTYAKTGSPEPLNTLGHAQAAESSRSALGVLPTPSAAKPNAETHVQAEEALTQLPLCFIENRGQHDERVAYYTQQGGADIYFTAKEVVMALPDTVLRTRFVGVNEEVYIAGGDKQEARFNYFKGNDRHQWQRNVRSYAEVTYHDVYTGVDLTYSGRDGTLKYEFLVQAEVEVDVIRLAYAGVDELRLADNGDLLITPEGASEDASLRDTAPIVYQEIAGERVTVDAGFMLRDDHTYGFRVGEHDPDHPLIIDPQLRYSTFLGGGEWDESDAIALDNAGNVYVTGRTSSNDFPTTAGAYDGTYNGGYGDVFVGVLDPTLSSLRYATFLGGSSDAYGRAIALDDAGNVYVTGPTWSGDFPTTAGAYDETYNGGGHSGGDIFVSVLDPTLSTLCYSTFLGGSDGDDGNAVALDGAGNVYVTGGTSSNDFPTTAGAHDETHNGGGDVFVSVLNPTLDSLSYATFVGGASDDRGDAIALDHASNIYLTGGTSSNDFPTTAGAHDETYNGGGDVFVSVLNPTLDSLSYATFVGGTSDDRGDAIALDDASNIYLTGGASSSDFPTTTGAYDTTYNGGGDVFVSVLNPTLGTLTYSTFLGGSGDEIDQWLGWHSSIALDSVGHVYVTGYTASGDFPTTAGAYDTTYNGGGDDVFVSVLDTGIGATYSISGHVQDGSGDPISGVTVSAGADSFAMTDASGAYTITNLGTGTYTLAPTKSGWTFTPPTRTVSVPPSATGQDFVGTSTVNPPTVTTLSPSTPTLTSTVLNGRVNPNGSATVAWFEWGTESDLTPYSSTPPLAIGSGIDPLVVTATLPISVGVPYYYRITANNDVGTSRGMTKTLTTLLGRKPGNPNWNRYDRIICSYAIQHGISPSILKALFVQESSLDARNFRYEPGVDLRTEFKEAYGVAWLPEAYPPPVYPNTVWIPATITVTKFWQDYHTTISMSAVPLPAPKSLSPGYETAPGESIGNLTPELHWEEIPWADHYAVFMSEYPYGSDNLVYSNDQVHGTSVAVPSGELEYGQRYRWNVRAHGSSGWGSFSKKLYFRTPSEPAQVHLMAEASSSSDPRERQAQWRLASSYGLGQLMYTFHGDKIRWDQPETFYDPYINIRAAVEHLTWLRDSRGCGEFDDFSLHGLSQVVLAYNMGHSICACSNLSCVRQKRSNPWWWCGTVPCHLQRVSNHVAQTQVVAATDAEGRDILPPPSSIQTAGKVASSNPATVGYHEVDRMVADLKGTGQLQLATLGVSIPQLGPTEGILKVFADTGDSAVEWQSPSMTGVLRSGVVYTQPLSLGGPPLLAASYGVGAHSSLLRVFRWDGESFRAVSVVEEDGEPSVSAFADAGTLLTATGLMVENRDSDDPLGVTIIDTYNWDEEAGDLLFQDRQVVHRISYKLYLPTVLRKW